MADDICTPVAHWKPNLNTADTIRRRNFLQFTGNPAQNSNTIPGVLASADGVSPTVPKNRYWLLWHASCISAQGNAAGSSAQGIPQLYLYIANATLPNTSGTNGGNVDVGIPANTGFFLLNPGAAGPRSFVPLNAIRVDDLGLQQSSGDSFTTVGNEINLLRHGRHLIIGPGESLYLYLYNNLTNSQNNWVILRLLYSEYILPIGGKIDEESIPYGL